MLFCNAVRESLNSLTDPEICRHLPSPSCTQTTNVTESFDAKRLLKQLLTLRTTTEAPLRDRILALDTELTALDQTIATRESALNTIIYRLYNLTPAGITTIEAG